jgi:hypothetical protein
MTKKENKSQYIKPRIRAQKIRFNLFWLGDNLLAGVCPAECGPGICCPDPFLNPPCDEYPAYCKGSPSFCSC